MRVNIFEGGRRITTLLQVLWFGGALWLGFMQEPTINVNYTTYGPGLPFIADEGSCELPNKSKYIGSKDIDGTKIYLSLCFKASEFKENKMLIPYKEDEADKTMVWGAPPYSNNVENYAETRAQFFEIPTADKKLWKEKARNKYWKQIKDQTGTAFIGAFIIWVIFTIIGWIMRGFMGIPQGQDVRPEH